MNMPKNNNLLTLLSLAEEIALKKIDGHLTIMRFTTHWKCMLGTPNLDSDSGRTEVGELQYFNTLEEALRNLIILHN